MFFDHAKIFVAAGKGGNGCVSFRREMHVPRGGPDGGDGGRGGDVVLVADPQVRDLQAFRYQTHFKAGAGRPGSGACKHGAEGESVVIPVPLGTQVRSEGRLLADLVRPGQRVVVARGGAGGRGNARFANSVRQAPRFAELGEEPESRWLELSLKLMADAGLAGLPNAGKSSLLRRLSNAKPKVADYPFTTVEPMLGVVDWSGEGDVFTLADVPGLLEGASEGVGLGHEFLAHLERCHLILHVVDLTGYYQVEPLAAFHTILGELQAHASSLADKPQVVLLNKIDAVSAEAVAEWRQRFVTEVEQLREKRHPAFSYLVDEELPLAERLVWPVSAATGAGLASLLSWVGPLIGVLRSRALEGAPPAEETTGEGLAEETGRVQVEWDEEGAHATYRPSPVPQRGFTVRREPSGFVVEGPAVRRLVSRFDLTDEEAIQYLGERLERLGVYAALAAQGAQPGDEVDIEGHVFEFR
jgi:GTP-binding protein